MHFAPVMRISLEIFQYTPFVSITDRFWATTAIMGSQFVLKIEIATDPQGMSLKGKPPLPA